MKITESDVRHVAALAELAIEDDDVPLLASQLEGIVNFVAQLKDVAAGAGAELLIMGPERTPLRPDEVDPIPLHRTPGEMAPAFQHGFYVVPRLGGLVDE